MTIAAMPRETADPRIDVAVRPLIERLVRIQAGRYHVVSCYLRLGPHERAQPRYLTQIRRAALRDDPLVASLGRDDRMALERDLARVMGWLERPAQLPHARGLAIFACEALELFEAVPLPRVHRTRLVVDDTPWVAELVALEDELDPVLVALIDRTHLRFFEVTPAAVLELPGAIIPARPGGKFRSDRADAPGWGERDYHHRLREERHRRYAMAGMRLAALARGRRIRGIVLAGPGDHTAALTRFLPGALSNLLLGTAKLNPSAARPADVQMAALATAEAHHMGGMAAELGALEEALGTGWATDDLRETLRALSRGQVRTLYVQEDLSSSGFRCSATGRLVPTRDACRGEGAIQPVRDLADEAIEQALHQHARVVLVPRRTGVLTDGLAATLRFR